MEGAGLHPPLAQHKIFLVGYRLPVCSPLPRPRKEAYAHLLAHGSSVGLQGRLRLFDDFTSLLDLEKR